MDTLAQARQFRSNAPLELRFPTLRAMLEAQVKTRPDSLYLISYDQVGTRTCQTYSEFFERVGQGAARLTSLGVKRGDRVATFAANHAETVVAYFATLSLGACLVPVNMTEDAERRKFILENSEARVLLALGDFTQAALSMATEIEQISHVVQLTGALLPGATAWVTPELPPMLPDTLPEAEDEALIVYTSGTTGAPKGVVLTQANLVADAHTLAVWNQIEPSQRMMCVLPIHHVNGLVVTLITPMY
ncbi:MAG: acyl--CoA ligase, partial [Blastocatellia bacterium]|nr:acyl--CoA ligase [Blastocatellia bacterium]